MAARSPFEKRIVQMQRAVDKLVANELPKLASQVARAEFELNFRDQGLRTGEGQVQKWPARQNENRTAGGRRNARRSILVKTNKLRHQFRLKPVPGTAVVENYTPYAAIHNRGGRIRGQMRAWATNRRSGKTRLRPSGSPAYMPARPFMVTTPLLLRKIEQAVHEELVRVLGPTNR